MGKRCKLKLGSSEPSIGIAEKRSIQKDYDQDESIVVSGRGSSIINPHIQSIHHSVHQSSGVNQSSRCDGETRAGWQRQRAQSSGLLYDSYLSSDALGCVCADCRVPRQGLALHRSRSRSQPSGRNQEEDVKCQRAAW